MINLLKDLELEFLKDKNEITTKDLQSIKKVKQSSLEIDGLTIRLSDNGEVIEASVIFNELKDIKKESTKDNIIKRHSFSVFLSDKEGQMNYPNSYYVRNNKAFKTKSKYPSAVTQVLNNFINKYNKSVGYGVINKFLNHIHVNKENLNLIDKQCAFLYPEKITIDLTLLGQVEFYTSGFYSKGCTHQYITKNKPRFMLINSKDTDSSNTRVKKV